MDFRAALGYAALDTQPSKPDAMARDLQRSALFARIGGRKPDRSGKFREITGIADAARSVLEKLGGAGQSHLAQLWLNWTMVMGADIAPLAIPLGSRGSVLLVGGEDTMVMQELSYMTPEMLERANAFMNAAYFDKVELRLLLGKTALDERIRAADVVQVLPPKPLPPRPEHLGGLLGKLDPESAVGRCYAAYVRLYANKDNS